MARLTIGDPESIILWTGIAIMFVLFGVSACFREWAKIEEVRYRHSSHVVESSEE